MAWTDAVPVPGTDIESAIERMLELAKKKEEASRLYVMLHEEHYKKFSGQPRTPESLSHWRLRFTAEKRYEAALDAYEKGLAELAKLWQYVEHP